MKSNTPDRVIFFTIISIYFFIFSVVDVFSAENFVVSIPTENILKYLQGGERIESYAIELPNSEVYGLMKIQSDWIVSVINPTPPSDHQRFEASAGHGVSYLTNNDVKNGAFNDFLIVTLFEGEKELEIKAHIKINIPLEENLRKVVVEKKDMVITPMADTPILKSGSK